MPVGQDQNERDDARPRSGQPEPRRGPARDPHATPLGRGADPGATEAHAPLRASESGSISRPRGAQVPGARGGAPGLVDRESDDVTQGSRSDEASPR